MNTHDIKWYRGLNFKGTLVLVLVAVGLVIGIIVVMNTRGKQLVLAKSSDRIEQIGNNIVSDLNARALEVAALTRTLGAIAERLSKSEATFKQVIPDLIDFQADMDVAGGGVWPEPYAFAPDFERRSFFWGRDPDGFLRYYDDYNLPGSGYHNEEWYVVARHLEPGRCSWSKSYMDPYSYQPMVTATVATYDDDQFSGTVTIDLKLEGLQAFAEYWQKKAGGYLFILDRNNKFITFPDPMLVKKIDTDESGRRIEEFMLASEFAQTELLFFPIAEAVDLMNRELLASARQMPGYNPGIAEQIDNDSYQINQEEAELLSAIVADPLVKTTFYQKIELEDDFINREQSTAYFFFVPQSYWKIVIVKPISEATQVASNMIRLIIIYLAITIIPLTAIAYFILNRLWFQPLAEITDTVKTMSAWIADKKLARLKNYQIEYSRFDEIGILSNFLNTLVSELQKNTEKLVETDRRLQEEVEGHRQAGEALRASYEKLEAVAVAHQFELEEKQKTIEVQQAELQRNLQRLPPPQVREKRSSLSIIQMWEGIFVVPHVEEIDTLQASNLRKKILATISETPTEFVMLNLKEVSFEDAKTVAEELVKTCQALKLAGATCILISIPPEVVESLVAMGTELSQINAFANFQQGLRYALSRTNYEVNPR